MKKLENIIFWLFAGLFFFVPLILWPYTSEVFEFNKIVLTYIFTILICASWAIRMTIERKIIFRRTLLDIPLLIFLSSQLVSTLLSLDVYTSVFGYYSRFNGGFLSSLSYSLLYWAAVSNIDSKNAIRLLYVNLISAVFVCIYGVAEHFGIDKDIWVQDVQSRVFSTLGQPNWLAAWVTALIPLTWSLGLKYGFKQWRLYTYLGLSLLFFWTLIFTKSRSGLLGFSVATIIFWGYIFVKNIKINFNIVAKGFLFLIPIVLVCLISGTQWTPSISEYFSKTNKTAVTSQSTGTALESGGTESGTIRKIVWRGALQVFNHYPIFGTGVETFAFSYYLFRPIEHNLTSEWDYIYNKAHNEFLNFAANSGTFGILSYLILIAFVVWTMLKSKPEHKYLSIGFLSGYVSLSVSNFFGFSVVPTQLQFFLFPALLGATLVSNVNPAVSEKFNLKSTQVIVIVIVSITALYALFLTLNYWKADTLYAKAKANNSLTRPDLAVPLLTHANELAPNQAIYLGELSVSYATLAMAYEQSQESSQAAIFTQQAVEAINKAVFMAPSNINLRRQMFGIFVRLSTIDEKYLLAARNSLIETIKQAPTDAKLYYNLGIADANLGQNEDALKDFEKSIELKPDYADARLQYAALLTHLKRNQDARRELNYILEKIDPGNTIVIQALENLN